MRVEHGVDLSDLSGQIDAEMYKRLKKTHIRLLSSNVPESFIDRFEGEEAALEELLDVIYGTMECEDE
jgi:hypothetical protein